MIFSFFLTTAILGVLFIKTKFFYIFFLKTKKTTEKCVWPSCGRPVSCGPSRELYAHVIKGGFCGYAAGSFLYSNRYTMGRMPRVLKIPRQINHASCFLLADFHMEIIFQAVSHNARKRMMIKNRVKRSEKSSGMFSMAMNVYEQYIQVTKIIIFVVWNKVLFLARWCLC